jgi:inner membrane transporter RhtA
MFAIISVLIGMLSVQLGASFAKGLFPIIGAVPTVMLRISIAAIILAIIWRPWRAVFDRRLRKAIVLYGTCLGFMNLTFYLALTRIPLGICVALEFTGPLSVALLSSKQKIDFIWAFLAALGIVLILPLKSGQAPIDSIGILLALLAGLCWAFYIVFGQKLGTLIHGGYGTSLGMIVASLVTLPFGLATVEFRALTPKVLLLGTGVAILSSAIPYSIEMFAMKKIPAKTFGILMSVEPAIAALSGLFILGEHLDISQWTAILCVITASAGSSKSSSEGPRSTSSS